jgi:hypothetical protein
MKKITLAISLIILIAVALSPTFAANYFSDVPNKAWYQSDLNDVTQDARKIVVGFPDGTFKPNGSFTVAQLATCVVKASYYMDLKNTNGNDVWYKVYVDKSKELKYILEGEFVEKDYVRAITRGEMARIVARAVENIYGVQTYRDEAKIKSLIKDYDQIPANLRESIIKVYDLKIIGGFPDGTFKANEPFNRAQAVTVMNKLINPEKRINATVDTLFQTPPPVVISGNYYKINPDIPQELYQYAFRENDFDFKVTTNKALIDKYGITQVSDWMKIGKDLMETLYNVNYKTYSKSAYVTSLEWFFAPSGTWKADDGVSRNIEDHIEFWSNMIEDKQVIVTTEFITDPSLVYASGSWIVRGQMNYKFESCNDLNWLKTYTRYGKVELGHWYSCIVDVQLSREVIDASDANKWEYSDLTFTDEYFVTAIEEMK